MGFCYYSCIHEGYFPLLSDVGWNNQFVQCRFLTHTRTFIDKKRYTIIFQVTNSEQNYRSIYTNEYKNSYQQIIKQYLSFKMSYLLYELYVNRVFSSSQKFGFVNKQLFIMPLVINSINSYKALRNLKKMSQNNYIVMALGHFIQVSQSNL